MFNLLPTHLIFREFSGTMQVFSQGTLTLQDLINIFNVIINDIVKVAKTCLMVQK